MAYTAANRRKPRNRQETQEEYFDYVVRDPEGRKIGRVVQIFTNSRGEPQYVRIRAGILGNRLVLIPVLDVAVDHEDRTITLR